MPLKKEILLKQVINTTIYDSVLKMIYKDNSRNY